VKTVTMCLVVFSFVPVYGQSAQPSVKRHPGETLHYRVTVEDGDLEKITHVSVNLFTQTPNPANQPGLTNGFTIPCKKSTNEPKIWDCSEEIPDRIWNGDYTVNQVNIGAGNNFGKNYQGDYHVPTVPIENPKTFNAPTKIKVTE